MARLGELKSMSALMREKGDIPVKRGVIEIVSDLTLFYNVGKTMTPVQIESTAELIILEKKYLSLPDLQVCFRRAKAGNYGKLFDRIDGGVIFDFINAYEAEKTAEAEHQSYTEHSSFKKKTDTEKKPGINAESQRIIDEIKTRLDAQIQNEREEKRQRVYSNAPTQLNRDQKWMIHFDGIWQKKKETVKGQKFIDRYGLKLSIDEYLLIKSKQYERVIKTINDLKRKG